MAIEKWLIPDVGQRNFGRNYGSHITRNLSIIWQNLVKFRFCKNAKFREIEILRK